MQGWTRNLLLGLLALALAWQVAGAAGQEKAADTFVDVKGTTHRPLDTRCAKAVVLLFITTDCPIANYYTSEISALVKDHSGQGVRFYAIHVDPELTPARARKHADEYGLTCPVLIDATHRLVKATGATITPEAAVLTPDGKVAYRGRIDDTYVELGKRRVEPGQRDLRDALAAVLAGRPVKQARTMAVGCPIPDLP
ncbi:MAG: redoxin domain-containing protein [Gemmataceae bacterium]|nr:redoxin domain-containing protein [Gemmataceae bacterium]